MLLGTARRWGLQVYEQDWLDDEFDRFAPVTQSATLGREWLTQMNSGAMSTGLSIQYCMSHVRRSQPQAARRRALCALVAIGR